MKRIDQKVQEIEKKDKQNRILFIGFVVLILAFMAIVLYYQDQISKKDQALTEEQIKNSQLYKDLEEKKNEIEKQKNQLEASQTPIGYWNQTDEAKTASTYIDYILHTGKPEALEDYKLLALKNIAKEATKGKTAWLFCGDKGGNKIASRRVMKIVYRQDQTPAENVIPEVGDIIENDTSNRITYRSFTGGNTSGRNNDSDAWKRGSKAQVQKVEIAGSAVFIQIKF